MFPAHLSSSVHHSMSSFPFISTGKCWSFPCLMELERVVIVRTFPNYKKNTQKTNTPSNPCNQVCEWELRRASFSVEFEPLRLCRAPDSPAAPACPSQRHTEAWNMEEEPHLVLSLLSYRRDQDSSVSLSWVPSPTCSCPAGFPRSIGHGEQQRPR